MRAVSWPAYWEGMAKMASTRSTCPRASVGVVLVKGNRLLSTGYNGSLSGMPHCEDMGCIMEQGHCISAVHAEQNAVAQAAMHGVSIDGADCYLYSEERPTPCPSCYKLLRAAGVKEIHHGL